jgi:cytochrome c553
MGPQLSGQTSDMIVDKLAKYKNGDTIGTMSNVMWGQASWMTEKDMRDIGNYVETL